MTLRAIQAAPGTLPSANDPSWLARFLASLAREDLSPATLRGYRYDLRHFLRWHQGLQDGPFEPGRLAEYDLITYRQEMIAAGAVQRRSIVAWRRCADSAAGCIAVACLPLTSSTTFGRCVWCATASRSV